MCASGRLRLPLPTSRGTRALWIYTLLYPICSIYNMTDNVARLGRSPACGRLDAPPPRAAGVARAGVAGGDYPGGERREHGGDCNHACDVSVYI
jgi:hypothetical protein